MGRVPDVVGPPESLKVLDYWEVGIEGRSVGVGEGLARETFCVVELVVHRGHERCL